MGKKYIIVAGGARAQFQPIASVEIYDLTTNDWEKIDDLPKPVMRSQLIEDGRGGVLMVGGETDATYDIFYLPTKNGIWERISKSIGTPRYGHVAMMIPDALVPC